MKKCTCLTLDLVVTLIRTFRRGIHPGAVYYIPTNISSMDVEHFTKHAIKTFFWASYRLCQVVYIVQLCLLHARWSQLSRLATNQQSECAPSEDSDQPGHPPSLIRVFAVRMKKTWILSYPLSAQRRLCVFAGRTATLLVLSRGGLILTRTEKNMRTRSKVWLNMERLVGKSTKSRETKMTPGLPP